MSIPEIFRAPIPRDRTIQLALETFEDMVKFVVDTQRRIICAGGGLHSDEEQQLLEDGSLQEDLWGGNYYLNASPGSRLEYTSMINVRPDQGNAAQEIQSPEIRKQMREIALYFFESSQ